MSDDRVWAPFVSSDTTSPQMGLPVDQLVQVVEMQGTRSLPLFGHKTVHLAQLSVLNVEKWVIGHLIVIQQKVIQGKAYLSSRVS